jgi:homoserine O-acetyltransferase/O-succinyltransferase
MFCMRKTGCLLALLVLMAAWGPQAVAQENGKQQLFADLGTCKLVSGQQIQNCRLGYRTWGKLNAERTNAILWPTWFSGISSDIAMFLGPNGVVDTGKYYVVVIDALANGVSSAPSNSTTQHGPDFPAVTIQDMVNAEHRLATETLHLTHVHAVMGMSMGGMQAFEWMVDYPQFMDVAIPIIGSPKLTGFDLALWRVEEDMIKGDPAWQGGRYTKSPALGAVQVVHQMHLGTPEKFAHDHPPEKFETDYDSYFTKGILPFDANDWIAQLEAMIHQDIAHGGSLDDAAARVKARVLVVVSATDMMVNPKPAEDFAAKMGAKALVLGSDCGHGATTCETARMVDAVTNILDAK